MLHVVVGASVCVCVCVCVRACVRACVCACARARVWAQMCEGIQCRQHLFREAM